MSKEIKVKVEPVKVVIQFPYELDEIYDNVQLEVEDDGIYISVSGRICGILRKMDVLEIANRNGALERLGDDE